MNLFFKLFQEIKRRKIFKPIAVYASFAFITIQVTDVIIKRLFFPDWIGTLIVIIILLGFPITFFLSWIYDITPNGIKKTDSSLEPNRNSSNILFPFTGLLSIIGVIVWFLYSMSDISHGSILNQKIIKSIAVLYLENLSNDKDDENLSAALTQGIITSFSKLQQFDVKARTDVLKFKNKIYDHNEVNSLLNVDAYLDGSITRINNSNTLITNFALVDAEKGNNIWVGEFKKTSNEILQIPELIISEIAKILPINNIDNSIDIKNINNNSKDFSLLGKAMHLLDGGNYNQSISIIDTLIQDNPNNKRAVFTRAQAYEKNKNYLKAITDYSSIISNNNNKTKLKKIWSSPDKLNLKPKIIFTENNNIQILITKNEDLNKTNITALNTNTNEKIWSLPYRTTKINSFIKKNQLILTTTSYGNKEATIYIHDINNGKLVFSKEFAKTYNDEIITISPSDYYHTGWANNSTDDSFPHLLTINVKKNNNFNTIFINTKLGRIEWKKEFLNSEGHLKIQSINIKKEHYVLFEKNKKVSLYNFSNKTLVWEKVLENEHSKIAIHNNKLIFFSQVHNNIKIIDPESGKILNQFSLDSPANWWYRFDNNIIFSTNKSITSIKTSKYFFNKLNNWSFILKNGEYITKIQDASDNIFILTSENNLYAINKKTGKIINKETLNIFGKVKFYYNSPDQPFIINDDDFLIAIDPNNGKRMWIIREQLNHKDLLSFANNKIFIIKQDNNYIDIFSYNQANGDLIWQSNEKLNNYNLYNIKDNVFITSYKEAVEFNFFSLNLNWSPGDNYIPADDLYNRLAYCYIKLNKITEAEDLLKKIVSNIDQQNNQAYLQLSNLYLRNNKKDDYISALSTYYDLVKDDNTKKMELESKIMDHTQLQWTKDLRKKHEIVIDLPTISSILIGNCKQTIGCNLSTYRNNTGIEIWNKNYNIIDHTIFINEKNEEIILIGRKTPSKQDILDSGLKLCIDCPINKFNMPIVVLRINATTGEINNQYKLGELTTNTASFWKVLHINNSIIVDLTIKNQPDMRKIISFDSSGNINWSREYFENKFMRMKNIELINNGKLLIVPLEDSIEAININNGNLSWEYEYYDEFDGIQYISQTCLKNDTLALVSDDDEFIILDIHDKPRILFNDDISFDKSGLIYYMDPYNILLYDYTGSINLYNFKNNEFYMKWNKNLENIHTIKNYKSNIYILNENKTKVIQLSFVDNSSQEFSLIWQPENIFINSRFISCINNKKLYLLSL